MPAGFADPDIIPRHDQHDADPALIAAFAAVRPVRTAAVLVPVIERDEPSVLFTQRTSHLRDHGGQISFPGGKIDASDAARPRLRCARPRRRSRFPARFVDPIGYLDIHLTPFGHRIMPVLARVRAGFALRLNPGEVEEAFEVPLAFLMIPKTTRAKAATGTGSPSSLHAMRFGERNIWGATAAILRNLYERVC